MGIKVKIATEKRLKTIDNLSLAILEVAKALTVVPTVIIHDSHIEGGISVEKPDEEDVETMEYDCLKN